MENMQTGLLLMAVGMTTVFIILLVVIYLGKGLIALVNKYAPEEVVIKKKAPAVMVAATPAGNVPVQQSNMDPAQTAAIVSAISTVTGGEGKVTRIERI